MRKPRNDASSGVMLSTPAKAGAQTEKKESVFPHSQEHSHVPERTCVLTRRKATKDELIRLALSPDGEVAPDVRARAPGRGAWIGVCRTDLHIVERDLLPLHSRIIPVHQIVGEVIDGAAAELSLGSRAGVSWIGGVDGDCWYCRHAMENLCDHPVFTGYSVNGGYAE